MPEKEEKIAEKVIFQEKKSIYQRSLLSKVDTFVEKIYN